jgi:hypothetical protein
MDKKEQDRILQTPSEANRDKHVNFVAQEHGDVDPAMENSNSLFKKEKKEKKKVKRRIR